MLIGECGTVIVKQTQLIGGLEKSKTDEGILPDHNYILRTESDLMMGGLQRQLLIVLNHKRKLKPIPSSQS